MQLLLSPNVRAFIALYWEVYSSFPDTDMSRIIDVRTLADGRPVSFQPYFVYACKPISAFIT